MLELSANGQEDELKYMRRATNHVDNCRRVQILENEDGELVVNRCTYVTLRDGDFSVAQVADKVADSLTSADTYVILDSRRQPINDCAATRGNFDGRPLYSNICRVVWGH